jgi:hypothetical protein
MPRKPNQNSLRATLWASPGRWQHCGMPTGFKELQKALSSAPTRGHLGNVGSSLLPDWSLTPSRNNSRVLQTQDRE